MPLPVDARAPTYPERVAEFLIIHGFENHRPENHWHRHLATNLRARGHQVAYPQLPNPDQPVLSQWLEVVDTELQLMKESSAKSVTVIAHSLGCITWLQYLQKHSSPMTVDRVLLVAPADPQMIAEVAPTFVTNFQIADSANMLNAQNPTLLSSDADPWLPRGVAETFAQPLGLTPLIWQGAGHLSRDDGFGYWQGVIDWAQDSSQNLLVH